MVALRAIFLNDAAPEAHPNGSPMAAHESDTVVLKSLLAISKAAPGDDLHVVAEIYDERTEAVARMVTGDRAGLVLASPPGSLKPVPSSRTARVIPPSFASKDTSTLRAFA